jgi:hypothetical protein
MCSRNKTNSSLFSLLDLNLFNIKRFMALDLSPIIFSHSFASKSELVSRLTDRDVFTF